ncbi:MAG: hypothetical protein A2V69_03520 [Candidatus Portnoybacteria bacterium RBG_13_40_8]|uniref:Uncharacterized protein n=1 Tax=Candidatus Portnoybacteria bacterium RBG_13_40_8 TaxID=1801990 RepID=A0A1G2F322_9BACT|nr:MAG: hypothetical protein A2V69_03520 [Candidatus Portnoybacteria bacterium RBG_13_40_8]
MENKKQICENLIQRWNKLKAKLPYVQDPRPIGNIEPGKITPEEMQELSDTESELKENCLEFLSLEEQWEIKNKP